MFEISNTAKLRSFFMVKPDAYEYFFCLFVNRHLTRSMLKMVVCSYSYTFCLVVVVIYCLNVQHKSFEKIHTF